MNEETFISFSQYVYTGDYDEAKPSKREASERVTPSQAALLRKAARQAVRSGLSESSMMDKQSWLWNKFQALYPLPSPAPSPGLPGPTAIYDYTDVFLSHARMYVFADYYGIDPLQILALQKLRLALTPFSLCRESYGDIIQLVQYSFEQTVDKGGQDDGLRSLVCLYAACKVENLWKNTEFKDATKNLPDFTTGLITAMLDRLD